MSLLSKQKLRLASNRTVDEAKIILRDLAARSLKSNERYDIFLSHRFVDAPIILALKYLLEKLGFSVFVDWIDEPGLSRNTVNRETAEKLRSAMRKSASLLYAVSENTSESKWMPWELGFSDSLHGRVAIVPITEQTIASDIYSGQEYLSLYPYITSGVDHLQNEVLFVKSLSVGNSISLRSWLR